MYMMRSCVGTMYVQDITEGCDTFWSHSELRLNGQCDFKHDIEPYA
jgi:hypothetical protein